MSTQERLAELVSLWQIKKAAGESITPDELCRDCPNLLGELHQRLDAMKQMNQLVQRVNEDSTFEFNAADSSLAETAKRADAPLPAISGYEIREVLGQGGMGIVYKAEHRQLGHVVALKMILSRHYVSDQTLKRFQAEAAAVAQLQHPNIVQLHDYGQHDGLPYFTLEFMVGGSLHQRLKKGALPPKEAARLVEQLARGMQYAHQAGFIHRDLKPHNILLAADGTPKVSDFGLVKRAETDQDLTRTGEAMGTPAYMAPEQALGETKRVGPAADVYALGAILYECLTGRPPFRGKTLAEVQHQVIHQEPPAPRSINSRLPRDLETICCKCLHKDPQKRYPSAEALASDLHRFQSHEPIQARPVSRGERLAKWVRRHPTGTALVVAVVMLLMVGFSGILWYQQVQLDWAVAQAKQNDQKERVEQEVAAALADEAHERVELLKRLTDPKKVHVLLSDIDGWKTILNRREEILKRAAKLVANIELVAVDFKELVAQQHAQFLADRKDWNLAKELDDIRLKSATLRDGKFDAQAADKEYLQIFGRLKFDLQQGDLDQVAAQMKQLSARLILVAALDHWTELGPYAKAKTDAKPIPIRLQLAKRVDPDPWRDQVRDAVAAEDQKQLQDLAKKGNLQEQSPQIILLLAYSLLPAEKRAAELIGQALVHYSGDFWLNFRLGNLVKDPAERVGCYRAALAIRPQSSLAHHNLGLALKDKGELEGAIQHFQKALELNPKLVDVHNNLGVLLGAKNDLDGAIQHYHNALKLDTRDSFAHINLGAALHTKKDLEGAIKHYNQALKFNTTSAVAHNNLGLVFAAKKDQDGAITHFHKATELDPKCADAHSNLGLALYDKKDLTGAIQHFRKAVELNPKDAETHNNLGVALAGKKDLEGAIQHFHKAIELQPQFVKAYNNVGRAHLYKNDLDGAIQHYRKALNLDPKDAETHNNLGVALAGKKDLEGAIEHFHKAIELQPENAEAQNNLGLAHNDLGVALAGKKDLAGAIQHFQQAIEHKPKYAEAHSNLGLTLQTQGNSAAAVTALNKAIALDPNNPLNYGALGQTLLKQGSFVQAKKATLHVLKLLPPGHPLYDPAQSQLKECERLLVLDQKLTAVLQSKAQAKDVHEQLALADLCMNYKEQYASAAKFYAAALAEQPNLANQHRYNAACAATLAASGKGNDSDKLKGNDKSKLRQQALDWLKADLADLGKQLQDNPQSAAQVRTTLLHWQTDPDLPSVRDAEELAKLLDAERKEWQQFWAEVQMTLKKAGAETKPK